MVALRRIRRYNLINLATILSVNVNGFCFLSRRILFQSVNVIRTAKIAQFFNLSDCFSCCFCFDLTFMSFAHICNKIRNKIQQIGYLQLLVERWPVETNSAYKCGQRYVVSTESSCGWNSLLFKCVLMWQCQREMKNDSLIATDANYSKFRCVVLGNLWLSFLIQMDSNHLLLEKLCRCRYATKQIPLMNCKTKTHRNRCHNSAKRNCWLKTSSKMFMLTRTGCSPSVSIRCYQNVAVLVYHSVQLSMLSLKLCFCSTSNQYRTFWLFKTT